MHVQRIIRQLTKSLLSASVVFLRYAHVSLRDPMLQQCHLACLRHLPTSDPTNCRFVAFRMQRCGWCEETIINMAPIIGEYVTKAWRENETFRSYKFVTEPTVVKSRATLCVRRYICRNWGALCQAVHIIFVVSTDTHVSPPCFFSHK